MTPIRSPSCGSGRSGSAASSSLLAHAGGILCDRERRTGRAVGRRQAALRQAARAGAALDARRAGDAGAARKSTARRPDGAGTPWRTGPAGGSRRGARPRARSAPRRGQQLGGLLHAHARQVVAERGVADLGVRALELAARGRDAARDVVEREVAGVLLLDDRDGVLEQAGAVADGGGSLNGHAWIRPDAPTG